MPTVIRGHTNAPAIVIGEVAADLIRAVAPDPDTRKGRLPALRRKPALVGESGGDVGSATAARRLPPFWRTTEPTMSLRCATGVEARREPPVRGLPCAG